MSNVFNQARRDFLGAAAMTIAAAQLDRSGLTGTPSSVRPGRPRPLAR